MGVIYKLTFPNRKSYIGKTTRTIEKRTKEHNLPSNKCPALNRAIQKYSTYETEILIEIDDSLLNDYEEEFILTYNTIVPNGYNLTYGGDGGKHCEETKQKLRLSKLGTKLSDETKENMRKAHSNRIVSEFWKKRISEGLKGHLVSDETRQKISNTKKCNFR